MEIVSVDLSLFVLLYITNFMSNLKFKDFLKTKNISLTIRFFFILQNHPIFYLEERLVNLVRGRECFAGLSILFIYALDKELSYAVIVMPTLLLCIGSIDRRYT